jgi:heterodisulfide reductase subunit B
MCHLNLDARQPQLGLDGELPILHGTQLAALAFGLNETAVGLGKNVVNPRPLLADKGLS